MFDRLGRPASAPSIEITEQRFHALDIEGSFDFRGFGFRGFGFEGFAGTDNALQGCVGGLRAFCLRQFS